MNKQRLINLSANPHSVVSLIRGIFERFYTKQNKHGFMIQRVLPTVGRPKLLKVRVGVRSVSSIHLTTELFWPSIPFYM